jgi:hypothetical protein
MASARWNRFVLPAALAALTLPPLAWLSNRRLAECERPEAEGPDGCVDRALGASMARARFKEGLAKGIVGGRLSLREAAARLRDYHSGEATVKGATAGHNAVAAFPGATEEERCARHLAMWVCRWVEAHPESRGGRRLAARLGRELAESYGAAPPGLGTRAAE